MTDTPPNPREVPPVSRLEATKSFIGDLARPFALYATGAGTAVATVIGAMKCEDGIQAAAVITAAGVVLGGMYGLKEWGNTRQEVARTNANAGNPTP
jgi:hypothetical protein